MTVPTNPTGTLQLSRPTFREGAWHDYVNDNMYRIDAAFASLYTDGLLPAWANSTAYTVGAYAYDTVTLEMYQCLVAHTSAAAGAFSVDRAAHPTYWQLSPFVTTGGTQTLTNKTLTSPTITGGTISNPTVTGTLTNTGNGDQFLELIETSGGAVGATLTMTHFSGTPANNDTPAQILFKGYSNSAIKRTLADIKVNFDDVSNTSEDASIRFRKIVAGALVSIFYLGALASGTADPATVGLPLGQIDMPAVQNSSNGANTWDDYEEGGWTARIDGTTAAGAGTYSTQAGTYNKNGREVNANCSLVWTAHTGTGNMKIANYPFTSPAFSGYQPALSLYYSNLTFAGPIVGYIEASSTTVALETVATGAASTALPIDVAATIRAGLTYLL